jgi:chemotaxis protein MotB
VTAVTCAAMTRAFPRSALVAMLFAASSSWLGCGYTEEEYALQLDKLARQTAKARSANARADEAVAELEDTRRRLNDLERRLRGVGLRVDPKGSLDPLSAALLEWARAAEDTKARGRDLDATTARIEVLRASIEALGIGATTSLRGRQLVVTVPGDLLFDAKKSELRKEATEPLVRLSTVLSTDPSFEGRDAQVGCHLDDAKVQGAAKDALGLTALRARAVVAFLTNPKGPALSASRWSAAGFGAAQPLADNDEQGRAKNRRCEITTSAFEPLASSRAFEGRE